MSYPVNFNDTVVYDGVDLYLPKDCSLTIFEDSRLYLYGEVYYNGAPLGTGGTGGGTQVFVGPTQPTDPNTILWFDTSTGYGELKAKVSGSWKMIEDPADTAGSVEEVYIGATDPGAGYELWVDTVSNPPAPVPPAEGTVPAGIPMTPLMNGWTGSAKYRKYNGILYLTGGVSGGSAGTVFFVLPVGYRPVQAATFTSYAWTSGGNGYTEVTVRPNGEIQLDSGLDGTPVAVGLQNVVCVLDN